MNKFRENLIKKLGEDNLKKIERAKIGIAGAGGLGSNCASNLVRVGFKKFTIVDDDIIDPSNLDRQFYFADQTGVPKVSALEINLLRINPCLELKVFKKKVIEGNIQELFGDCDVVVECFDNAETKSMLVSGLLPSCKFIVSVSGLGGIGRSDEIKINRIKKNLIVIGDLVSGIDKTPALSPRVNIAAAKQADVILEYVIG